MFDKLRERLGDFRKAIDDKLNASPAPEPETKEAPKAEAVEQKTEVKNEAPVIAPKADSQEPPKTGILDRAMAITRGETILSEKDLEGPLWELEMALLESDVALPVAESIIDRMKKDLSGQRKKFLHSTGDIAEDALRDSILNILSAHTLDFDDFIANHSKPVVVVFTGVNGTGKTTTIAKLSERLKEKNVGVVIAAGDTFRAGAIEQLEKHAERLGIKMVKHEQGSDPAAVIYDAITYAKSNKKDVVLADTAGRLHTYVNLMEQLKKISRVNKPDLVIFVDEAIAGNDAVERAKLFNDCVPISGSILTKADADSKGGAAISIAHITGKPILFLGIGQEYKDLKKFDPNWFVDRLLER